MKISQALREKTLLSFELFPPKTEKGMENLPGTIDHLMKYKPAYISCTYGAGGGNVGANREVCQMIKKSRYHTGYPLYGYQKYQRGYQRAAGSVSCRRC